jgi:hypothetical protein
MNMRRNGEFILLKNGTAVVYTPGWDMLRHRLKEEYEEDPGADYVITQVVGTVDKPAPPVVRSIYEAKS